MGCDHVSLASLQGPIEILGDDDVLRNESPEPFAKLRRQVYQYETGTELVGSLVDLGEAVHGG